MNIWKFELQTENGDLISRHKTMESIIKAFRYCKTCQNPIIKEL